MRTIAIALLAAGVSGSAGASTAPANGVVKVEQGVLSGTRDGTVIAYLGIPFAAPPTGENRWRAPKPAAAWSGVRSAKAFGGSCPQPHFPAGEGPYTTEFTDTPPNSEDCLFLNVWAPSKPAAKQLPVIVWIHGGGFGGGAGGVPIYHGKNLASRGTVVVSINYRLGPLGFLAHPELSAEDPHHSSGNYGLLDQIAALQWVKRNIGNFGGDSANITIAGQSAGAASVNDLVVSPLARGLFRQAIAESGSGIGIDGPALSKAELDGQAFANYLGAKSIADLRGMSVDAVLAAVAMPFGPPPPPNKPRIMFRPILDGYVLPEDPANPASTPALPVPLITGFNTEEAGPALPKTPEQFEQDTRKRFGKHADTMLALYPHATDAEATRSAQLIARDRYMTSLVLWTEARHASSGEPIYRYLFTQPVPVAKGPSFGAFHTAEVPYVFGNFDIHRPYTSVDRGVSDTMQSYWLNFARTGNPNGAGQTQWQPVGKDQGAVMVLGPKSAMGPGVSSPERLKAFRTFVADGGSLSLF